MLDVQGWGWFVLFLPFVVPGTREAWGSVRMVAQTVRGGDMKTHACAEGVYGRNDNLPCAGHSVLSLTCSWIF